MQNYLMITCHSDTMLHPLVQGAEMFAKGATSFYLHLVMKAGDVLSFPPRAQLRTSGGSTCTQRIHLATPVAHTGSLLSGIDTERP